MAIKLSKELPFQALEFFDFGRGGYSQTYYNIEYKLTVVKSRQSSKHKPEMSISTPLLPNKIFNTFEELRAAFEALPTTKIPNKRGRPRHASN